ncbi:MAG: biotin/lipoyl-containing protein, partial [Pelagibacteraceae bacterium]
MSEIVKVPNIGDFKNVEIIEVLVKEGDEINKGDPVITLESDKSSVEVPSSFSGKISNINIKIGDKVSEGDQILEIITDEKSPSQQKQKEPEKNEEVVKKEELKKTNTTDQLKLSDSTGASPNTLKFARELGINISELQGSGRGGRVKKDDIKNFVKNRNI